MEPLRISDDDREAAVRALGEQYAEGRLTKEEFDERSDAAWTAKTRSDLRPLFEDLPVRSPEQPAQASWATRRPAPALRPMRHGRWRGFPLVPVIFLLVAITLVTRVPFLLLAIGLWFVFARCRR